MDIKNPQPSKTICKMQTRISSKMKSRNLKQKNRTFGAGQLAKVNTEYSTFSG